MKPFVFIFTLLVSAVSIAQNGEEKLPYYEIPEQAKSYTAGTVSSRMVDGLGFRYYWATEGLRSEDLAYKASESGRTTAETIDHLFGLSSFILNSVIKDGKRTSKEEMSFQEKRKQTLLNFEKASKTLRNMEDVSQFDNDRFPFWNIINGPISDALWHCGQVVMLRRASGNPFNSKVSVFEGKIRE